MSIVLRGLRRKRHRAEAPIANHDSCAPKLNFFHNTSHNSIFAKHSPPVAHRNPHKCPSIERHVNYPLDVRFSLEALQLRMLIAFVALLISAILLQLLSRNVSPLTCKMAIGRFFYKTSGILGLSIIKFRLCTSGFTN